MVISDIEMGDMSGIDLLGQLRKDPRSAGVPVILCTALATKDIVMRAASLGISGFVRKPIDGALLQRKVLSAVKGAKPPILPLNKVAELLNIGVHETRELLVGFVEDTKVNLVSARASLDVEDRDTVAGFGRNAGVAASNFRADPLRDACIHLSVIAAKAEPEFIKKSLSKVEIELERLLSVVSADTSVSA